MNMKILITGADGLLGRTIRESSKKYNDISMFAYSIKELDICDRLMTDDVFKNIEPDWIINCAAYTNLEACEERREESLLTNIHGPQILGSLAAEHGAKMLHVSTAFVFDGQCRRPYTEDDLTAPETIYGKTKRLGELALLKVLPDAVIVRTSRLYGPNGRNFITDILSEALEKTTVDVISDQISSPTFSGDLAECIFNLIHKNAQGLYHYANRGSCSWYDFAKAAVEEIQKLNPALKLGLVKPVLGLYYHTQVKRPAYSVLDTAKYQAVPDAVVPHWRDSLRYYLHNFIKIENNRLWRNSN